jgi:CRISPR-associated endonuclease Csn1
MKVINSAADMIRMRENWEQYNYQTSEKRKDKNGNEHIISYTWEDIWHICFSFDDEEAIVEFAKSKLQFNDKLNSSCKCSYERDDKKR